MKNIFWQRCPSKQKYETMPLTINNIQHINIRTIVHHMHTITEILSISFGFVYSINLEVFRSIQIHSVPNDCFLLMDDKRSREFLPGVIASYISCTFDCESVSYNSMRVNSLFNDPYYKVSLIQNDLQVVHYW